MKSAATPLPDRAAHGGATGRDAAARAATLVAMLVAILFSATLAGCADEESAAMEDSQALAHLRAERERWVALDIRNYQFSQRRFCGECPPGFGGVPYEAAWQVTVVDGAVVAAEFGGVAWPSERLDKFYNVEGLFALTERALREAGHSAVTYDADYAFPAEISIDWVADPQVVDDEQAVSNADFQPL